jgi:3-hydroxybutyryl-CoA dehydratase
LAISTGRDAERDWGPALAAIPVGHTESVRKTVSETDVYLFAGITGDFAAVHVDEEFCRGTRYGRRIAHGALLVGFISTVMGKMTALLPAPGGVSYRYEVKFTGPVFIGDTVTTALTLAETRPERRELAFRAQATNQRGETVLEGQTVLKLI